MRAIPTIQTLVVVALLVGSVALSVGAAGPSGIVPGPPDTAAVPASGGDVPDSSESEEPRAPRPDRVVVYYFHRTLRCDTCLKFEAYTDEALSSCFTEELDDGELEWRVANLDDPGSEHFVDDYHITENSVVVVEFRGGEQREWANLDAIWGFVGDKPTFLSYIRSEVEASLSKVRKPEPTRSAVRDSLAPSDDKSVRR
ncbi:MAG: nitrophenyl compound nitroreductase subunit ArsF family protein [Candidatus Eisenbacteria bacterium]